MRDETLPLAAPTFALVIDRNRAGPMPISINRPPTMANWLAKSSISAARWEGLS